jgi:hypothetical protein
MSQNLVAIKVSKNQFSEDELEGLVYYLRVTRLKECYVVI